MKYQLQVISTPSSDTGSSLCLFFPNARYIFGIPEGTTRMCIQRKQALKKLRGAFLSEPTDGGLAGLTMSFADTVGQGKLNVIGPEGTLHRVAGMRYYNKRDHLKLQVTESLINERREEPLYADEFVSVYGVTSYSNQRNTRSQSNSLSPDSKSKRKNSMTYEESNEYKHRIVEELFPGKELPNDEILRKEGQDAIEDIPPINSNDPKKSRSLRKLPSPRFYRPEASTSYIVVGKSMRGKFNNEIASKLQIPGPLRSKLTNKESVFYTLKDGTEMTVKPEDVVAPDTPPTVFFVINVPSQKQIASLIQSPTWFNYREINQPHVIVHNVGPKVLDDARYTEWMKSWGDKVHHLISSPEYTPNMISLPSSYLSLKRSSYLSDAFNVPLYSTKALKDISENDLINQVSNLQITNKHHVVQLNPPSQPEVEQTLMSGLPPGFEIDDKFNNSDIVKNYGLNDKAWDEYSKASIESQNQVKKIEDKKLNKSNQGDDVIVTSLGTGSALPSKYRNVSATLIQTSNGNILLDTGEGTFGQLARRFGERCRNTIPIKENEDAWSVLKNIKIIYISHVHADHHIGLAKLLKLRAQVASSDEPVYIISSHLIQTYLREQNEVENLGLNYHVKFIDIDYLNYNQSVDNNDEKNNYRLFKKEVNSQNLHNVCESMQLKNIQTALVQHRAKCFGGIFEHKDGWKIVYSGDTLPCENLVEGGKNATLLIHEATMEDGLEEMAHAKGHSTIGQAIDIGKRMNASKILLTHFSQRYSKLPQASSVNNIDDKVIAHGFDLLSLKIGDMWKMSHYSQPLTYILANEINDNDEIDDEDVKNSNEKESKGSKKSKKKQDKRKLDHLNENKNDQHNQNNNQQKINTTNKKSKKD